MASFFVAKIDNKIIGFGRLIDRRNYVEIASLGVDFYYQGQGIGKKLLRFLIEQTKNLYPDKGIYGVTHRPGFLKPFGFEEIKNAPQDLYNKKYHQCILNSSKIKIMRLMH